jgi:hypothetical protein
MGYYGTLRLAERGVRINFIERIFGISPDGGDSSTELMILAAVVLIAVLVTWRVLYIKSQL